MPGKTPIERSMFYTIAKNITGGGKQQEARAGVDYIKVNFHTDNFVIVDKIVDVIAPLSDLDHTLRDEPPRLHVPQLWLCSACKGRGKGNETH